jgi:GT2 family glycosyltransferase
MPDISIIVPTLDPDPTFGWEDQLAAAAVDGEVIPRDDPTASGARNAGIRESTADKLVFLDDDSSPTPGYFDRVSALLDDHPAVTGRIIDTGPALVRGLSGQYDQGGQGHRTETVVGCNMAVRRSVLEDVGGFEERLPYGHEERELADRICERHYVWYDPELVVEHPYADSVLDYYGKAYRHGREEIAYYQLRGRNVHREIARNLLLPTRYLGRSLRGTVFSATGQLVRIAGLLRGYQRYARGERSAREPDRQTRAEEEPDTP